jgi:hypothetical protein
MLQGKTRIPPVDIKTLPDDLREVLEEQRSSTALPSIRTFSMRATRRSSEPRGGCGPPSNRRRGACPDHSGGC